MLFDRAEFVGDAIRKSNAIQVQIVAVPVEANAADGVGIGGRDAAGDGGGSDAIFGAEDEDGVVGGAADDLDIASSGGKFGFADDDGRREVDGDAFVEVLSDHSRAKSKRGGADGGKFLHVNSPELFEV